MASLHVYELISKLETVSKALNLDTESRDVYFEDEQVPPDPVQKSLYRTNEELDAEDVAWSSFLRNFRSDEALTLQNVEKKFKHLWFTSKVKGRDVHDILQLVSLLQCAADNPVQVLRLQLCVCIVHCLLHDLHPIYEDAYVPLKLWNLCADYTSSILNSLKKGLHQNSRVLLEDDIIAPLGSDELPCPDSHGYIRIWGDLAEFIVYLHYHLNRGLRVNSDPFTPREDFEDWLPCEDRLFSLAQSVRSYLQWRGQFKPAVKVACTQVQLVYYKLQDHPLMDHLLSLIDQHGAKQVKTHALLCAVYHHAIMGRFYHATDLLSNCTIDPWFLGFDSYTVTPYNRAIAQVGLCAYRLGLIKESYLFLSKLFPKGNNQEKVNQLLGQCYMFPNRTPHEEKLLRMSQMPRHMHIDLKLLEAIYVMCAMLVEVPKSHSTQNNPRTIICEVMESGIFIGDFSDAIMDATADLYFGDYKTSFDAIQSLDFWRSLGDVNDILEMLKTKMKEAVMKIYLGIYEADQKKLCNMHDLSEGQIHSILAELSKDVSKWSTVLSDLESKKSSEVKFERSWQKVMKSCKSLKA